MESKSKDMLRRIEQKLEAPSLADKVSSELSPSDLNALLTEVFALRAKRIAPHEMVKRYAQNPYVKPAVCSAAQYCALEADMLLAAEKSGAQSILLSPAALLGCCSVFGAVSQNKIISATRNLEILSDATNMLALYIAAGLTDGTLSHAGAPVHLCATHRHIRYQPGFDAWTLPHFGIFTMVSAGKSRGSYGFEMEALLFHLRFYRDYWQEKHGGALSVSCSRRPGYKDSDGFFHRIVETAKSGLPDMEITINEQENCTTYYKGLQATIYARAHDRRIEIGDIGFTDWTQKLLNRPSERLLISAMALDRQMML